MGSHSKAAVVVAAHSALDTGVHGVGASTVCSETEADNKIAAADTGGLFVFGDGSDGDITISENTNLTRDMFYNTLTVNGGITLSTKGYRIFVRGTLTNNGTIEANGGDGTDATPTDRGLAGAIVTGSLKGAGGANGGMQTEAGSSHGGGSGGGGGVMLIIAREIINNGIIEANGGDGGNANGVGSASSNQGGGGGGVGNLGGAGGKGGTGWSAGGAGGSATLSAIDGGIRALSLVAILHKYTSDRLAGGGGGGGGAPGRGEANAGGGGGGGGGVIIMVFNIASWGTEQTLAGTAGNGYGAGANGTNGSPGNILKFVNV